MNNIKLLKGWHMPEYDTHYEKMMKEIDGKWEYQADTRKFALSFVKNWNLALDIGGNIGFWSEELCNKFKKVWAFEPHPLNIECYRKNMKNYSNWQLEEVALSDHQEENATLFASPDESGNVSLVSDGVENGSSHRKLQSEQLSKLHTDVKKLDDYLSEFEGQNIDFIKVDVQAHEKEIVYGGLELLKNHNAVLCLELPLRNDAERKYHNDVENKLRSIGYIRQGNMRKETIFTK